MSKHPIDKALARMSQRDRDIAEKLSEAGFSDEDLYAALPTPRADKLIRQGASKAQPSQHNESE